MIEFAIVILRKLSGKYVGDIFSTTPHLTFYILINWVIVLAFSILKTV